MCKSKKHNIYTGQISLKLFQICGLWKPLNCNSQWKLKIYYLYSIFTITLYISLTFLLFVYMFQIHDDVKDFTQSVFYFSTYFNVLIKLSMVVIRRDIFIKSNKMLLSDMCQSRDNHEVEIIKKCSDIGRYYIFYANLKTGLLKFRVNFEFSRTNFGYIKLTCF